MIKLNSLLLSQILNLIEQTRQRTQRAVNSEMVVLYWQIGQLIRGEILGNQRADYGEQVIRRLAEKLSTQYGKGFGARNVAQMVRFAEVFPDQQILQTVSAKLTWSHIVEIMARPQQIERDFYIQMAILEGWSVRVLRERVKSLLFERTALSRKPEITIAQELELVRHGKSPGLDFYFRDPYVLDFLELQEAYSEKDLENAILRELERFLLEFGTGFSFISRQKRITVGEDDFYIDLLLFHRGLRCLVALELKLEKFQPQFAGQMQFYLRYLDQFERQSGEEAPIGLILCAGADKAQIELMDLERDNIRVAQYLTKLPPLELLQKHLLKAIEFARSQHKEVLE